MNTHSIIGFRRSCFLVTWDLIGILSIFLILASLHNHVIPRPLTYGFLIGITPLALLILRSFKAYDVLTRRSVFIAITRAMLAWLLASIIGLGGFYVFKVGTFFPRSVVGLWIILTGTWLSIGRLSLAVYMNSRHKAHIHGQPVLIIGTCTRSISVYEHLNKWAQGDLHICGISSDDCFDEEQRKRMPFLGPTSELPRLVDEYNIQRVIIATHIENTDFINSVFAMLAKHPVIIQLAPDISQLHVMSFQADSYDNMPIFTLIGNAMTTTDVIIKWLEDKIICFLLLPLLLPILLIISVLVKITSTGPIFFVQRRHGLYGKPINVIKFRTMTAAASEESVNGTESTEAGKFKQAQPGDRRITKIGRFLRATSLDELPQIFNVLGGSMSIVGPRPHPVKLNHDFTDSIDELMRRHYMKPGITGLAQINGARGETKTTEDMKNRISYDLEYIRNWSPWLDIKILLKTFLLGFINDEP